MFHKYYKIINIQLFHEAKRMQYDSLFLNGIIKATIK